MKTLIALATALLLTASSSAQTCPPAPLSESFDSSVPGSLSCGITSPGTLPAGWTLDASSTNAWRPHSGSTTSSQTGPSGDRTSGSGIYLYTETSCSTATWTAILNAPCIDMSAIAVPTLEFGYHMYGASMGSLTVEQWDGAQWNSVWTRSGDQGDMWHYAQVMLTPVTGISMVRFVGIRGSSFQSDMAIDDVRFGEPTPAQWQQNSSAVSLDIDQVTSTGAFGNAALATKCFGGVATVNAGGSALANGFDLAIVNAPLVAARYGTPGGQVLNVDLWDPSISFLNSGNMLPKLLPVPTPMSLSVTAPAAPITVSGQGVANDPTHPDGFVLSQGVQLDVVAGTTVPGPAGDDSSVTLDLGVAPLCGPSSITFFGTTYTQMHVSSNGRVMFVNPDTDYSPTLAEALSDDPFCGYWTDLNPSAGGNVSVSATNSQVTVNYNAVPYFGTTVANSFSITFDATNGNVTLDGLNGIMPNINAVGGGNAQFLGLSMGNVGATDAGLSGFGAGLAGLPTTNSDMLYDFWDGNAATAPGGAYLLSSLQGGMNRVVFAPSGNTYAWVGL